MKRDRHLKRYLLSLGNGGTSRRAATEICLVVGLWLEGVGHGVVVGLADKSCGNQAKDPGLKGSTP